MEVQRDSLVWGSGLAIPRSFRLQNSNLWGTFLERPPLINDKRTNYCQNQRDEHQRKRYERRVAVHLDPINGSRHNRRDDSPRLSPVGSIWYAWVPGFFYLPGNPIAGSLVAPPGWTATAVLNSIQFVASSSANDILAGHSLSGFSYQANFTPAQLVAAPNSGLSVAYSGGIESGAGFTFTVEHAVIPEPSTLTLLVCGAVGLLLNRRRKLQSA